MPKTTIDPLTLSMQWAKLQSVVDEASAGLVRTAFSRIVTEANDFTCALFDADGEMIIQSTQGLTSFTGVLAIALKHFLRAFPEQDLAPGDCLIMNDPWLGASQVNDMHVVTPIFHRARIVGYAANISHCPDVGAGSCRATRGRCSRRASGCPCPSSSFAESQTKSCSGSS